MDCPGMETGTPTGFVSEPGIPESTVSVTLSSNPVVRALGTPSGAYPPGIASVDAITPGSAGGKTVEKSPIANGTPLPVLDTGSAVPC